MRQTNKKRVRWLCNLPALLWFLLSSVSVVQAQIVRYEAESCNLSNANTASSISGYAGTGYVTNLTSEWSRVAFERSYSNSTPVQVTLRYLNNTGSAVNNLAIYQGSTKIQNLSFPTTAAGAWSTISVNFTVAPGYQGIALEGETNASSSIQFDYFDLNLSPNATPAPGTFSQTAPAASATGVSTSPGFSWGASSNAASYTLVVATNSTYTSPIINQTGITSTSYTSGTALANSTTYYWKVTAVNSTGSTIASNAGISFATAAPALPGAFSQTTPAAAATGVSATPSFSWGASSGASSYTLTVSVNSNFTSPIINQTGITGTSHTSGTALAASTTYYWRVTAVNGTGSTVATNAGLSFTTAAPPPAPGAFTQSAPASGASGVSTSPAFSWAASSNASSYTLVVSTSSSYTSPIINQSGITGTNHTSGTVLAGSTTYYWKVTAVNGSGSTIATNAGLSFTTASAPPASAIRYEAENCNLGNVSTASSVGGYAGSGYVQGLTSEWSRVAFERSYNNPIMVQVFLRFNNPTGNTVNHLALYQGSQKIQDLSFPPTNGWSSISVTFDVPAGYQGIALEGETNNSSSILFDYFDLVLNAPPPAPGSFTQTAPGAGATGVISTPNFTWGASQNASTYTLVVSTNSNFSSPVINQSGITGTSYTSGTALAASTTYYWKVTAVNGAGSADASNAGLSFTTAAPPPAPGAFTQSVPAASAANVSTFPAFSWTGSSNASSYTLVVSTNSNLSSPIINQSGINGTNYTYGTALAYTTVYYWRVTAVNISGSTVATNSGISFTTAAQPPITANGDGKLIRDYWAGIPGTSLTALTGSSNYPGSPTSTSFLTTFDAPRDVAESFGARIYGYIKAPSTGTYTFKIASDDNSELWISTNESPANKVRIAYVEGWTNQLQFDKYGTQSGTANMVAGQWYFVEALHKEGTGGDHLTVAWIPPGGSQVTVPGSVLSSALPTPIPLPGSFTQTAPAAGATGVNENTSFTWAASSSADSYSLVVSTSSTYANPIVNATGINATAYTPSVTLAGTTTYYWKVTAVNVTGSTVASNAGISFTTRTPPPPPLPGAFTQNSPSNNSTGVSLTPSFTWNTATSAATYSLLVSTSSTFANPVINVTGLTNASYSPTTALAGNTTFYWKVTAVNVSGSTVATNAGISFVTAVAPVPGATYYVSPSGLDAPGRGSSTAPYRTLAYAATQVPANLNNTIYLNAGTYSETVATVLPRGVNIQGAGESLVTITSNGPIPAPGVDQSSGDWKLWYDGSLIQLIDIGYSGANPRYGPPENMLASQNGNQTLSGFTIDGNNKQIKAGVWVQNRNNVTMHHVTIRNCQQRGAVFSRSDMWWYIPLPDGKWMHNTTIYNCTFLNNGAQLGSETLGNLCLSGLDGADIYNININDNVGYGIKFINVGHYRNVKIHDCNITVNEQDAAWGEKISIELWNLHNGNEVYNVNCNTWMSFVNHAQLTAYQPVGTAISNLRINNVRMIDSDGVSSKEAFEAALSGVEISDCYVQDKGFGIAIWWGGGSYTLKNYMIRNNIIANVLRTPGFGFGNSSGLFCPDASSNIKVYNNVFDRMGNGLQLTNANGVDVKNNVFLNTEGADIEGGSGVTFTHNLKYHTNPTKANFNVGGLTGTGNILGLPGFNNSGDRWGNYYKPASGSSLVVNAGTNVGLAYSGTAPDIGRWEYSSGAKGGGGSSDERSAVSDTELTAQSLTIAPNPMRDGLLHVFTHDGTDIQEVQIYNRVGQIVWEARFDAAPNLELYIGQLPQGLYIVKVGTGGNYIAKKLMVTR
jgi:PA14 domain/Secretion system C-terminal sorting domain/Right handed beta helix region